MIGMRQTVLMALAADGPLDAVELAKRTGDHPITVDRICTQLRRDGAIRTIGGGRYCLTTSGRERLPMKKSGSNHGSATRY